MILNSQENIYSSAILKTVEVQRNIAAKGSSRKKSENYWQFICDFDKPAEEAAIYQSRFEKIFSDDLVLYNKNSLNVMRKILENIQLAVSI